MRTRRTPKRLRRAAELVEFALVLPVFLAFLAGIIDYGWYFTQHLGVIQAAEAGARAGAMAMYEELPEVRAQLGAEEVLQSWDLPGVEVQTSIDGWTPCGATLQVEVSAPYDPLLHLVPVPDTLSHRVVTCIEGTGPQS